MATNPSPEARCECMLAFATIDAIGHTAHVAAHTHGIEVAWLEAVWAQVMAEEVAA